MAPPWPHGGRQAPALRPTPVQPGKAERKGSMPRLLITATHGYDNSSRASLPFFVARGAVEAGIDVGMVLALDAAVLVKPDLRKHIQPYGFPPLEELFQFAVDHKVPVYV